MIIWLYNYAAKMWLRRLISTGTACVAARRDEKDTRIQRARDSLSFFSRWKLSSYMQLILASSISSCLENEIVSGAISSLSLLPTHG